jgi:hypothetical protein
MRGEEAEAGAAVRRALEAMPDLTIGAYMARNPFRHAADRAHVEEGLRRAGLPE